METLGDFKLEAVLGQGGSGIVYDARWGPRQVALKVLHASLVVTDKERAQWVAEAERLQRIAHPSVVKVLAVGSLPDGRPYLAMERLDGETLASLLARGALPLARALALFSELCAAVAALHDQGLVHRDLKPENVFVVAGQHAVLLDFGIAKEVGATPSTVTQDGGVRGTPAYMAPERFFGQAAGVATDVYELAVTLYAMLAGRLPWSDIADPEARLSPRPLDGVPSELDVEIRRAMSTRAQNRPASARDLLAAVMAVAGSAIEPKPSDTAPLRSAEIAPPEPWFASRQPTTDRGKTPLAWAPTEASPTTKKQPKRTRWPVVAASIVAAGIVIAGAVALWTTTGGPTRTAAAPPADAQMLVAEHDPWGAHVDAAVAVEPDAAAVVTHPLVIADDGPRPLATYHDEIVAAVHRLPADTNVIIALQLGELKAQTQIAGMVDKLVKDARVQMLFAMAPPCVVDLVRGSEWAVLGAPALKGSDHAVMVVRGRWARADIEKCFGGHGPNTDVIEIKKFGSLAFVDDHTAILSNRADVDVHALATTGAGPSARVLAKYMALPRDRAIGFVADGASKDDWSMIELPAGTDVSLWLRVEATGVTFDALADAHDAKAAEHADSVVRPQLEGVFGAHGEKADVIGRADVERSGGTIRVKGTLTNLMLGMIASSAAQ